MKKTIVALAALAVTLVPAADAMAASKAQTIKRVQARLADKSFTRFTQTGSSSFDQRLHLCRNKSFIYDTVSSSEFGDPDVRRVEGSFRVLSARIKGRVWSARVRGTASDGSGSLTVSIRTDGRKRHRRRPAGLRRA